MLRRMLAVLVVAALLAPAAGALAAASPATARVPPPRANGFATITPWQAKALLETRPGVVIIDVRTREEFMSGALPGSVLVPFMDAMRGRVVLPPESPVLVVCSVGGRSLAVGRYLAMKGFREVYNLKGGLEAWVEQRVPLPRVPR